MAASSYLQILCLRYSPILHFTKYLSPKILSMPSAEEVTAIVETLMMRGNCSENAALDFLAVCPVDVMRDRDLTSFF